MTATFVPSLVARARAVPRRPLLALVPAAVLVLCSVSADEVAATGGDPLGMWGVLPAGPVAGDWVSAELSSTGLLLLAIALARGKRAGFWLALAVMAGAVVVQGSEEGHPIAAAVAVAIAALLVATRSRYDVEAGRRDTLVALGFVGIGALMVGSIASLSAVTSGGPRSIADAVGGLLDVATPLPVPGLAAVALVVVLARVGLLVATVLILEPADDERSPAVVAAARRTLRDTGSGHLVPYQEEPGCVPVADEAGRAAFAVANAGRVAVVLGDPSGDRRAAVDLLLAWAADARLRDRVPAVYQASAVLAGRLHDAGWTACLVGREARIDPVAFELRSPRVANLRHADTRARRDGLTVVLSDGGPAGFADPRVPGALARLDGAWRRSAGPALGFTVGRYDPLDRRPSLIAAALGDGADAQAFAILRPTGADGGWMLDLMRRAPGGVPGAVDACMVAAIAELARRDVRRLSLGLAPLSGLSAGHGTLPERALGVGARLVRPVYRVEGLEFFKAKFDPEWVPRYLVVPRPWQLTSALIALLRLHLGGSWPRVIRSLAGSVPWRLPARAPVGATAR